MGVRGLNAAGGTVGTLFPGHPRLGGISALRGHWAGEARVSALSDNWDDSLSAERPPGESQENCPLLCHPVPRRPLGAPPAFLPHSGERTVLPFLFREWQGPGCHQRRHWAQDQALLVPAVKPKPGPGRLLESWLPLSSLACPAGPCPCQPGTLGRGP